jgi:hypothetical protein
MVGRVLAAATVTLTTLPLGALAQDAPLSRLLPDLLARAVVTPSSRNVPAGTPGVPHEAHFLPDLAGRTAAYDLNRSIVTYLATFPIGSSSGGFTYETDPSGIPRRSSSSFGPAFAERALTVGKGQFSTGFNVQSVEYDRFEGMALDAAEEGGLPFYLEHNDCCVGQLPDGTPGPGNTPKVPAFEGDLLRLALGLSLKSTTAAVFASYGLTDRFDIGVAVPFVKVEVDAQVVASLQRLSATSPLIHTFVADQDVSQQQFVQSDSASGIGDVVFRSKYNFLHKPGGGAALGLDVRVPTGDKEELLGTGATQVKGYLIYSGDYGRVSPHLNVGYTYSSGVLASGTAFESPTSGFGQTVFRGRGAPAAGDVSVPDEINYAAGFTAAVSPRVTLILDAIGRTVRDANRFAPVTQRFTFNTGAGGPFQAERNDVVGITGRDNLHVLLGVAGVKLNVTKTLLLTANVLFPLNDSGLRAKVSPVVGLDYAF